jgi:cystathionine beta-lyase
VLAQVNVAVTYFDPTLGAGIADPFRPNTTLVFAESPDSQTFDIHDIPAMVETAHRRGAFFVLDTTASSTCFAFAHLDSWSPGHERQQGSLAGLALARLP